MSIVNGQPNSNNEELKKFSVNFSIDDGSIGDSNNMNITQDISNPLFKILVYYIIE